MRWINLLFLAGGILTAWILPAMGRAETGSFSHPPVPLSQADRETGLTRAIYERRSVRAFRNAPVTLEEAAAIAWAAQGAGVDGVTGPTRTVPSAGAAHPLEIFVSAQNVTGLPAGIYRYRFRDHTLEPVRSGNIGADLARASLGQTFISEAAAVFIIAADPGRTTGRYGSRGHRYVFMEAGASSQNTVLQAEALGLGSVVIGAFNDSEVKKAAGISFEPLLLVPVGRKR